MSISNETAASFNVEFTTLIEMISTEKTIRLRTVSNVIRTMIEEKQNGSITMYDEEGNVPYESTLQSKLCKLASFFSDASLKYEGTSDEFHNLSVDFARCEMYSEACIILERGIALRPSSVDLLADYLLYGKNIPTNRSKCQEYYAALSALPHNMWKWRAYSFIIEYLLEERYYSSSQDEIATIKKKAIAIAKEYIHRFSGKDFLDDHFAPDGIDKAYAALAGIYGAFGDYNREKGTLKSCVEKYRKAPVSSMRLADIEFSAGNYDDATHYLSKCVATSEPQPPVKTGYVFLLRAHSNASKLFLEQSNEKDLSLSIQQKKDLLLCIRKDLKTAEDLLDNSFNEYRTSIEILRRILENQYEEDDNPSAAEDWS